MRLIDFYFYYTLTLYKNKPRGNLFWDSPEERAAYIVGFTFTFFLLWIIELITFLFFKINIGEIALTKFAVIMGGLLMCQIIRYIYIVRERHEFLNSTEFKKFTLSKNAGVTICAGTLFLSMILVVGAMVLIHMLLKTNH